MGRLNMPKKAQTRKRLDQEAEAARNLDLEISFLEGLLKRDPDYVDALRILGTITPGAAVTRMACGSISTWSGFVAMTPWLTTTWPVVYR